jgi:hypothetical protein
VKRIVLRLPRHSTVAAYAALFVALGGVSYAAINIPNNSVKSSDIRNGNVRSPDVRNNNLRGVDIREASLDCGGIPNADCSADDATEGAGGSTTTAFSFRTSTDQTVNNLVNVGGLSIDVNCTGTDLDVTARTSVDDSWINTVSLNSTNDADPVDNQDNDSDFDVADPRNLLAEGDEGFQNGHTVYARGTGGPVVNVHWGSDEGTPNLACTFIGHVTVG